MQGERLADDCPDRDGGRRLVSRPGKTVDVSGFELGGLDAREGDVAGGSVLPVDVGEAAAGRAMRGEPPTRCDEVIGLRSELTTNSVEDHVEPATLGGSTRLRRPVVVGVVHDTSRAKRSCLRELGLAPGGGRHLPTSR